MTPSLATACAAVAVVVVLAALWKVAKFVIKLGLFALALALGVWALWQAGLLPVR